MTNALDWVSRLPELFAPGPPPELRDAAAQEALLAAIGPPGH
jgi:hypothetical protein